MQNSINIQSILSYYLQYQIDCLSVLIICHCVKSNSNDDMPVEICET